MSQLDPMYYYGNDGTYWQQMSIEEYARAYLPEQWVRELQQAYFEDLLDE